MAYQDLKTIYYKNRSTHEVEYKKRFSSPFTRHFSIEIHQYGHRNIYKPFLCYSEDMLKWQEKISQANCDLIKIILNVPDTILKQLSDISVVDEIRASSDIEGIRSTRQELKEIMDSDINPSRFSSIIKQYRKLAFGIEYSFFTVEDIRKFYDEFVHQEIVEENPIAKLDGKVFRKGSVDIASATGKTIHKGAFPEDKIIEYMEQALYVLNNSDIPFIVRQSIFHYFFEYIHPFYDGNGRTARFIMSYFMAKQWHFSVALRLSVIIKRNSKKYYNMFSLADAEINCGDMTPFVLNMMELVYQAFIDTIGLINRKMTQLRKYTGVVCRLADGDELLSNIYNLLLQTSMLYARGISVKELMDILNKSRNTIQSRLDKIPEEHIIVNIISKTKYYKLNTLILKKLMCDYNKSI